MGPIDKDDWRLETNGEDAFRGMQFTLKRLVPRSAITWDPQTDEGPWGVWLKSAVRDSGAPDWSLNLCCLGPVATDSSGVEITERTGSQHE
jgi:hypothetical protein